MSVNLKFGEKEKIPHNNNAGIAINNAKCHVCFSAELEDGDMAQIVKDTVHSV